MMTHTNSTRVKAPTESALVPSTSSLRTDEDITLNSTERALLDYERGKKRKNLFLSCKLNIRVSTLNVRTLRPAGRLEELARNFQVYGSEILGIIDHKLVHPDETIQIRSLDKCTLFTGSARRTESGGALGGVGILVSKRVEKLISDVKLHSERILQVDICGNPKVSIIVTYAPVNGSDQAEDFFQTLGSVTNNIPKHNMVIAMGDFNSHIGRDIAKHTYHETTNSNGELFQEYAQECNLMIANVSFQKRKGKLWTYFSEMNNCKTQIDYILVNRKWKNSVKDIEAFNHYSSLGSDHRVVTMKIKLSL